MWRLLMRVLSTIYEPSRKPAVMAPGPNAAYLARRAGFAMGLKSGVAPQDKWHRRADLPFEVVSATRKERKIPQAAVKGSNVSRFRPSWSVRRIVIYGKHSTYKHCRINLLWHRICDLL